MKELKLKYNELLTRYNNGCAYIAEHPEESEKATMELCKIESELSKIISLLPDMTEKEKAEGFIIEEPISEPISEPVSEPKAIIVKKEDTQSSLSNFRDNWEIAEKLCKSSIIPKEFQNKPENVLLCLGMSQKMGLDVITVMNNLQLVMGKQEWKGSFIPVLIERTGKYTDLEFNFVGKENMDDWGCYLEATRTRDGKRIKGTTITISMVKAEGWYNKNSKWKTMPQQMLIYRASSFFARAYCAAALNGISTEGEVNDINNRENPQDLL